MEAIDQNKLKVSEGKYVLLIEDIQSHAELIQFAIEDWDPPIRMDVIADGRSAKDALQRVAEQTRERPDLVLLDLSLPLLSGHELLAYIRAEPGLSGLPVVVTTSSQDEGDLSRAMDQGVSGYLVKPVQMSQLRSIFHRHFLN